MKIEYRPIGVIHTPFKKTSGMPIQPAGAGGIQGSIDVYPEFAEGLSDLDGFSHIILIYHFHKSASFSLKVIPFMDDEYRGVFATRAPRRPNAIGISVVKLKKVAGAKLIVENVDMLDGTPLLDIKPYFSEFDRQEAVSVGWLERHRGKVNKKESDGRFE